MIPSKPGTAPFFGSREGNCTRNAGRQTDGVARTKREPGVIDSQGSVNQ